VHVVDGEHFAFFSFGTHCPLSFVRTNEKNSQEMKRTRFSTRMENVGKGVPELRAWSAHEIAPIFLGFFTAAPRPGSTTPPESWLTMSATELMENKVAQQFNGGLDPDLRDVWISDGYFDLKLNLPGYFTGIFSKIRSVHCMKYPDWKAIRECGPKIALLHIRDDTAYIELVGHLFNKSMEKTVHMSIEMEIAACD